VSKPVDRIRPADWSIPASYTPLEPVDEYMIHSNRQPALIPLTTDLRAYDRMWFTVQDLKGQLYLVMGIGFYPNLQTADAHAQVIYKGRHIYIHTHRPLGRNRMNMKVGPIEFENVEPFKEWRISLEENNYGIEFDIRWLDTKKPLYELIDMNAIIGHAGSTANAEATAGYETFGVMDGWVKFDGELIKVSPETSSGSRDHHWGERDGVGGPGRSRKGEGGGQTGGHPLCGQWVDFNDWSVWGWKDLPPIDSEREVLKYTFDPDYTLKFDETTRLFTEGIITNTYRSGDTRELHWRRIDNQIAFLRCGGYGGVNGGTPDGDLWWGADVGELIGGGACDLSKPENQIRLSGGNEHLCEVSCGNETTIGIFEPVEPTAYEWCRDRRTPKFRLWED